MTLQPVKQTADFEVASRAAETQVLRAAGDFGTALRASPEFVALREAGVALGADEAAQVAIEAFNQRQSELRLEIRLGMLDAGQRAEVERLQAAMLAFPTVAAYVAVQNEFEEVCRETVGLVSDEIGIDFAANCRAGGCCGG